jgi:hypothetical protein
LWQRPEDPELDVVRSGHAHPFLTSDDTAAQAVRRRDATARSDALRGLGSPPSQPRKEPAMTISRLTQRELSRRPVRAVAALAAAACLAAAGALTTAGAATAAGPTSEWVTLEDTFTWDDCGFPVVQHDTGRLHFLVWTDESGQAVRRWVLAPDAKSSYTNPATGASVTSGDPFVVHRYNNADGTITVHISGLRFQLRGGGTVYVDSGRDILLFTESGGTVLSSVGPSADLCEALTAAIG